MKLGRNLLAGITNSLWSALVSMAVVPLYLKYLGTEAYGLIGFFATLQALLQLLDMGLESTINREIARCSISGNIREARNLLHTLAVLYWGMALAIAVIVFALAPLIAEHWLQSRQLSPVEVAHAVTLTGLVVACRWPIGLYQGALIGAQRMTVSSSINIVMVTVGNLGAVLVLAYVAPSIEAFFIWQAGVGILYAFIMRSAAWRVLGRDLVLRFQLVELKRIWGFSAGMSAIALSSLVFTQMDKLILSKVLGLEAFGHYTLATVVVSALYVLVSPLFNVIYPRFSALVASGDSEKLIELYRLGTRLLATVLFPAGMLLAFFAEDLVNVWIGNPAIAASVAPIITLLAIGSTLHGVMYFPYALQLAHGMTWIPLKINIVLMVVFLPLILFLALSYGALGGGGAWAIIEIMYLFLGAWLTHRYLLKGLGRTWLFQDVGFAFAVSLSVMSISFGLIQRGGLLIYGRLLSGVCVMLLVSLVLLLTSTQLRFVALNSLGWKRR